MSLAGSLAPPQIAHALWVFVRHLPLLSACHARAPLLAAVRPLVERLFHLLSEVSRDGARCPRLPEMTRLPTPPRPPQVGSLPAEQLCDLLEALCRLGPPYSQAPLAHRLAVQVETRLETSARPRPDLGRTSAGPRPDTRPPRRIGPHLGSRSQIEMRLNSNQLRAHASRGVGAVRARRRAGWGSAGRARRSPSRRRRRAVSAPSRNPLGPVP